MSYDWFEFIMIVREKQTEWLADLMMEYDLPKVILGKSFKPETNLVVGSPSILLKNILESRGCHVEMYDPEVDNEPRSLPNNYGPSVFLIGCKHKCFQDFVFPKGSIVIDPHRYIKNQNEIKVIRIGE